ncbi:TPA: hypothetical protein MAK64_002632 [Klebsiella aerogenes]|nr:hypothetical protein [Klebsiella aerogenes]
MYYSETKDQFENGFHQESDIFKRKPLFELIMNFINNSPEKGLVLALDDKWGNGKTSFLRMMTSEINNNDDYNVNVIYYDAFENDYHTDPFVSLTSEIYQSLNEKKTKLENIQNSLVETGKKVGASLLKGGVNYAINSFTGGLLNGSILEPAKEAISNAVNDPIEKYIEDKITSGKKEKTDIINFKKTLESIYNENNIKTVLIIDELDRARPDYSLDLLEKIKHLFSVEGFAFILSVNREQFEKSIVQRYGNIDSRTYLNKFVNYWFNLPKINSLSGEVGSGYLTSTTTTHILNLDKNIKFLSRNGEIINTLSFLIDINELSLREAERCYALLCAIDNKEALNNFSSSTYHSLIAFIAFLKVVNPDLLLDITHKRKSKEDILKTLNSKNIDAEKFSFNLFPIIHLLNYHYASDKELEEARVNKIYSDIELFRFGTKRRDIFSDMNQVIENFHIGR